MEYYIDSSPGRVIEVNHKKYHYFGGTSYLGLQTDMAYQELLIENIKKYGANHGASRISNVRLALYQRAEKYLADWTGSPACLTLSSGYLAGQLASNMFKTEQYQLFYAPNCHSALYTTQVSHTKINSYDSYSTLGTAIRRHLSLKNGITPVVLLDTIDFSGKNYPGFEGLRSLPLNDIVIVADDSHGMGIVGPGGGGVWSLLFALDCKELLVCCSLGKALGIPGGAIFGREDRISQLEKTDLFGGASPISPAFLATLVEGKNIFDQKRELLQKNIKLFTSAINAPQGITTIPGYPACTYSDLRLPEYLERNNILVTNFTYPKEDAVLTSRIVLSAHHHRNDIDYLAVILQAYFTD